MSTVKNQPCAFHHRLRRKSRRTSLTAWMQPENLIMKHPKISVMTGTSCRKLWDFCSFFFFLIFRIQLHVIWGHYCTVLPSLFAIESNSMWLTSLNHCSVFLCQACLRYRYVFECWCGPDVVLLCLQFKCCGVNNVTDWKGHPPMSCCQQQNGTQTCSQYYVNMVWYHW